MKLLYVLGLLGALFTSTLKAETKSLVLGGGCFWCTSAAYQLLPGVTHVTCGYAGGHTSNPTYEDVCSETTGHAEVIKIDYDPSKISLDDLLAYFWAVHNPTQVDGQGNDHGPSYRSIILYQNDEQKKAALAAKAKAQQVFRDPITTQIVPLTKFWQAEDYHQDYFEKHPDQGYCQVVIAPKIKRLQKELQGQSSP